MSRSYSHREESGFVLGEMHKGKLYGLFPSTGVLVRITGGVITGTQFTAESIRELGGSLGSRTLHDLFNIGWVVRAIYCTNVAAGVFADITDFNYETAAFTTDSIGANYVVGDVLELIPSYSLVNMWNYLQLDTGSLAAGAAGAAFRDAAFNRILTIVGICRIRLTCRASVAVTAGGNVRLRTGNTDDSIIATQVAATIFATIGNLWLPQGIAPGSEGMVVNTVHDFVVNALDGDTTNNVGIHWSAAPTAGRLVFDVFWQGLESGSSAAVGAGEAT